MVISPSHPSLCHLLSEVNTGNVTKHWTVQSISVRRHYVIILGKHLPVNGEILICQYTHFMSNVSFGKNLDLFFVKF